MHLLDQIAQTGETVAVSSPGKTGTWRLPGADILANAVADCPLRYVLNDDVAGLCTQLAFEDNTIIGSSLEIMRVPSRTLWIEFASGARHEAFSRIDRACDTGAVLPRQRIGLLVSGEDHGRRGRIDACWESDAGPCIDLAPFQIQYDLDNRRFSEAAAGDDGCIGVNVADFAALGDLFGHFRFRLRPQWHRYYRERAQSDAHYRAILLAAVRPQLEDVPFFVMFCLLLMSRSAFLQQACERAQLNKARARRGRPLLLDHIQLSMNLFAPERAQNLHVVGEERNAPRLHFVRGHLVRRGDGVHWRTSHMRGAASIGSIRSRTVSLKLASG